LRNLKGAESSLPDVDLDRLRADLAPWRRYLDDCLNMDEPGIRVARPSALPKIALRR
jgi:hypothetical protein